MKSLIAIAALLVCSGVWADGDTVIYECPNVRQGVVAQWLETPLDVPFVYGDCAIEVIEETTIFEIDDYAVTLEAQEVSYAGAGFFALSFIGVAPIDLILSAAFPSDDIVPAASGAEFVGRVTWAQGGPAVSQTFNMGSEYSGNCTELEVPEQSFGVEANSGDTYCSILNLDDDKRILTRVTWYLENWPNWQFQNPLILLETPREPTPVTTMPMYLLMGLSGLLALFGFYRVRVSK